MVKGMYIFCDNCGKKVYREDWHLKRSKNHYCSKECANEGKIKWITKICENCGKEYKIKPCKSERRFCSHKCSAINREKKGRSKKHLRKLNIILKRNWKNSKRCEKCGRLIGKNKHKCPTKKERKEGAKHLQTKKARKKRKETLKRLHKEGKLKNVGFQKGHSVPKEWTEKAKKTRAKGIKEGRITLYWKGKKRSEKDREKMSNSHIGVNAGENHYNWKGGISEEVKKRWCSLEYQKWRKKVFKKDDYTCQKCGRRCKEKLGKTIILNAHHIKPTYKYPKLMFKVSNGKTLCLKCHLDYHKKHGFKENENKNR